MKRADEISGKKSILTKKKLDEGVTNFKKTFEEFQTIFKDRGYNTEEFIFLLEAMIKELKKPIEYTYYDKTKTMAHHPGVVGY